MNNHKLETDRLLLRPIEEQDLTALNCMYTNPRVMQSIYAGDTLSEEKARARVMSFVEHWQHFGFGMWLLQDKANESVAGYAGLRHFEVNNDMLDGKIELGYIIDEPFWGLGYAGEAVQAVVQAGLNDYAIEQILATILPDNVASQRVACKAGLTYTFDTKIHDIVHRVYEISQ